MIAKEEIERALDRSLDRDFGVPAQQLIRIANARGWLTPVSQIYSMPSGHNLTARTAASLMMPIVC